MADFDSLGDFEGLAAVGAAFAFEDVTDVGDFGPGEIAAWDDVAVVVVELVGAADEVVAVF